jgi:hypothetical protein
MDPDGIACCSTPAAPRHAQGRGAAQKHLVSYIFMSVEFMEPTKTKQR